MKSGRQHNLHEDLTRDEPVQGSSDRGFGIVFAVVFTLIGLLQIWKERPSAALWWFAGAAAVALLAFAVPRVLAPFNRLWTKFGLLLHAVTNPVIMGLLFYAVVTPVGLLMRACGKDPLRLALEPAADSYWIVRQPPGPAPESIRRQF